MDSVTVLTKEKEIIEKEKEKYKDKDDDLCDHIALTLTDIDLKIDVWYVFIVSIEYSKSNWRRINDNGYV